MYDFFMRSEVLGRPESLVAVGLFAYKRSIRLGQVGAYVSLQMSFAKIRLIASTANEWALNLKFINATIWRYMRGRSALHRQCETARVLPDGRAWHRIFRSPQ
jgi:hypothetical protein